MNHDQSYNQLMHDLRNALAVIRLNAQSIDRMIAAGASPEKIVDNAKKIMFNVDRIAAQMDAAGSTKPDSN